MSDFLKELREEQKSFSQGSIAINHSDKKFFENFINEYNTSGKLPTSLSRDEQFIITRQRKKLKSMGIQMSESITSEFLSEISGGGFSDEKYVLKRLSKPFGRKLKFRHNNGKSYEVKQNIYADVNIMFPHPNAVADNEKLYCPHCGKIATLKQIEQGCEKCGNSSYITKLFPKVKAFFYRKNNFISVRNIVKTILICSLIGMLIGIPFGISAFIGDIAGIFTRNTIYEAIKNAFITPMKGIMFGIFAAVIYLLIKVVYDSVKFSTFISKTNEAKRRISSEITEHEGKFSYDNFEAKVISIIKFILYCDDRSELVNCEFKKNVRAFNIIDSIYRGFTELKDIHIEYGICRMTLEVYMSDIYYDGKRFLKKDDVFIIDLSKRLTKKTDVGFEISNVTCPVCFEHYNAFENKECSFCASKYIPDSKDWVITDLKIK